MKVRIDCDKRVKERGSKEYVGGWYYFTINGKDEHGLPKIEFKSEARWETYAAAKQAAQAAGHQLDNAGWKHKMLSWNFTSHSLDDYPGWEVEKHEHGRPIPAFVKLEHQRGKGEVESADLANAWDDIAEVDFYQRDWTSDGIPFVREGGTYWSGLVVRDDRRTRPVREVAGRAMSILDDRDITPEERAAIADEPRPGVWVEEPGWFGSLRKGGDGRALSQRQTDNLILGNVRGRLDLRGQAELLRIAGDSGPWIFLEDGSRAFEQRGGIHSDPLVRLLAFRAWGDRDRVWFEPTKVICRTFGFDEVKVFHEHGHVYVDIKVRGELFACSFVEPMVDESGRRRFLFDVFERACRDTGLPLAGQRQIKSGYDAALVALMAR